MAVCVIAAMWVFYCCVSAQCAMKLQYLQYLAGAQTQEILCHFSNSLPNTVKVIFVRCGTIIWKHGPS